MMGGLTSSLKPTLKSVFGFQGTENPDVRYFTQFDEVQSSRVELIGDLSLSGNLIEFEVDCIISDIGREQVLFTLSTDDASERFSVMATPEADRYVLKVFSDGNTPQSGTLAIRAHVLNRVKVKIHREAARVSLLVNGTLDYEDSILEAADFKRLYKVMLGAYRIHTSAPIYRNLKGVLANFKVKLDGETIVDLPLDEQYGIFNSYPINKAITYETSTPLSLLDYSQVYVGAPIDASVTSSGLTLVRSQTGWSGVFIPIDLDEGASYVVSVDCLVSTNFDLHISATYNTLSNEVAIPNEFSGRFTFILHDIKEGASSLRIESKSNSVGYSAVIKSITVSKVPTGEVSGGQFVNVANSDSRHFTTTERGSWLGEELITQSLWENAATPNGGWTYDPVDNTWTLSGDGSYQELVVLDSSENPPYSLLEGELISLEGAVGAAETGTTITEAGEFSESLIYSKNSRQVFKRSSGEANAKLARFSMRELIQVDYENRGPRYFTVFDHVSKMSIGLSQVINLANDFDIQFDILSAYAGARIILGDTTSSNNCIYQFSGRLKMRDSTGNEVETNSTALVENKMNRVALKCRGGTLSVYVNGGLAVEGAFGAIQLDKIGGWYVNSLEYNGIIANVKIFDDSVLILDMPIDQRYSTDKNIVDNQVSLLGPEKHKATTLVGSFVSRGSGAYEKTDATYGELGEHHTDGTLKANTAYRVKFSVEAKDDRINLFTRHEGTNVTAAQGLGTGAYDLLLKTGDGGGLWFSRANFIGTVHSVSIREVKGVGGQFTNNTVGDSTYYKPTIEGEWVGDDVLGQVRKPMTIEEGWSQLDGRLTFSKDTNGVYSSVRFGSFFKPNTYYETSLSVEGVTGQSNQGVAYTNLDIVNYWVKGTGTVINEILNISNNNLNISSQADFGANFVKMNYVKPILKPEYIPKTYRHFTTLEKVAQSYIILDSEIILSGDFTQIYYVKLQEDADTTYIFGNSADFNNRLSIFTSGNGSIRGQDGDVVSFSGEPFAPLWGTVAEIELTREGDNMTLKVNGDVVVETSVPSNTLFSVNQFGRNHDSVRPPEMYLGIKIISNDTLVLDMPVSGDYDAVNNRVKNHATNNIGTIVNITDADSNYYELYNERWVNENGITLRKVY